MQQPSSTVSQDDLALRQAQFKFEQAKAQTEFALRRRKAWMSSAAVAVPLLIGVATLIVGVVSQRSAARAQLQLSAAEIVMGAERPHAAKARVTALRTLFGDQLSASFDKALNLDEIGAPGRERQLAILQLVS